MKPMNSFIKWYQRIFYNAYYLDLTQQTADNSLQCCNRKKMMELAKNTVLDSDDKEMACIFMAKSYFCQRLTKDEAHRVIKILRKNKGRIRWLA